MSEGIAWLLGLDRATAIEQIELSFAAPWAARGPFWLCLLAAALIAASLVFYLKRQNRGSRAVRAALGISRGLLLSLVLVALADPLLQVRLSSVQSPLVYLIFDGTESMAIRDPLSAEEAGAIERAFEVKPAAEPPSRLELVQGLLQKGSGGLLRRLTADRQYRVEAFRFDGKTTSQLRRLDLDQGGQPAAERLAGQLAAEGQVTALGEMLDDVRRQFGAGGLSAVVVFSDFAHNAGSAPVGGRAGAATAPAARLGVPVFTVGVGAIRAADLAVDLQTDPKMKRAERSSLLVKLRQEGLQGRTATVAVTARWLSGGTGMGGSEQPVGTRVVTLDGPLQVIDFPFTPEDAGQVEFAAAVERLDGEAAADNNRAARKVQVIDDFLRLMYVAHEPTWEWRFVKEVFHRDKLVGMDGFRTYLASSDPQVRESNVLFLPTLTPPRSEFFANDVIFLGELPRSALSDRFCEMTAEWVSRFGGGLVIIAGPRFGPRELAGTALEELLPVIPDADARLRDERPFRLRLTPHAPRYSFMRLGESDAEHLRAWENLGPLPWYQPVAALRDQAYALAEHPTDWCRDGRTPQPLIAVQPYGNGEVVYLGFDEMWRLRRVYGERYYSRFWSQLIYRLGMSHALGSDKRFVVRADRQLVNADEDVVVTVEAYDRNFEPLGAAAGGDDTLEGELLLPAGAGQETIRPVALPRLRPGLYEVQLPVQIGGTHRLRVRDPVSGDVEEAVFEVAEQSAERRSAVRNERLQRQIAEETGGQSYDLADADRLVEDLELQPVTEHRVRNYPLWSTPLWFGLLVVLMLGEWSVRKLLRLP